MVFYREDMKGTMMGRFGPEECLGLACILERSGAPLGLGTRQGVMRACSRSPRVEWKGRRGGEVLEPAGSGDTADVSVGKS